MRLALLFIIAGASGLVTPRPRCVGAPVRPAPLRLFEGDDGEGDDGAVEARLSTTQETLASIAAGAALAAASGVEILDAGVVTSALLTGLAIGFAAENDRTYGVGAVARGVGRVTWSAFRAATKDDAAEDPVEEAVEDLGSSDFQDRLDTIRRDLQADQAKARAAPPRFSEEGAAGAD